jgi:thioredoxin reductase
MSDVENVIVIGSGPAGYTAGVRGLRVGRPVAADD